MKELSIEHTEQVSGGLFGDMWTVLKFIKNRNPVGILTKSQKLNEGEDEFLSNLRQKDRKSGSDRDGYNRRDGNYRRGSGGRQIEN